MVLGPHPNGDFSGMIRNHVLARDINRIEITGKFLEADCLDEIPATDINNSVRMIDEELKEA